MHAQTIREDISHHRPAITLCTQVTYGHGVLSLDVVKLELTAVGRYLLHVSPVSDSQRVK